MRRVNIPRHARLFVALQLPPAVIESLVAVQTELHRALADSDIRWVRQDNLHITLCFLGNVERARVPSLVENLQTGAEEFEAPVLSCIGIGCFPSLRAPRILWAGVREDKDHLRSIVDGVRTISRSFMATPPETRFTPHVTLGRCRLLPAADKQIVRDFVRTMERREFGRWRAHACVLMESERGPAAGTYRIVEHFPFRS